MYRAGMPKSPHEALHRIFQADATLFARAFERILELEFPPARAVSVINSDLTEMMPIVRRVDTPLLVETEDGDRHVVIIESQSGPEDSRRRSWPYYISYLNNKYECPVTLLVVTADEKTAVWAREPIRVGLPQRPSLVAFPLVLGPGNVPAVRDAGTAGQDVMMTVLSALTHRNDPRVGAILRALAAALGEVELETAEFLAAFTEAGLGDSPAAEDWRKLMTTMPYAHLRSRLRDGWWAEGRAEGRTEEAADAVLRVLHARGLTVPPMIKSRIRACTDVTELEVLLTRTVAVERAEDLFAD